MTQFFDVCVMYIALDIISDNLVVEAISMSQTASVYGQCSGKTAPSRKDRAGGKKSFFLPFLLVR